MIDPRQLETLAAVAEHGHFNAAADALHLTLAAVSLRIKSLEAHMGQRLLVRGKTVRPTPAGQALLAHFKRIQLMEQDLQAELQDARPGQPRAWRTLSVATNADSVASWFLPGVAPLLLQHRLLLDIVIDDQDHTHAALKSGDVLGCVTTLAQPLPGCVADPLGVTHYHCVAAPALARRCRDAQGRVSVHRLLQEPAVIFNRKDALQDTFLAQHFHLSGATYPKHFAPAVDAFMTALECGLGWGMVPEQHLRSRLEQGTLEPVLPGATVDVALYWQHWEREPLSAQRLTAAVQAAARAQLPALT